MLADEVCSTEKMISYCRDAPVEDLIVVTEGGMLHRLRKEVPNKNLIPGPTENCACADCKFMKMNTLEKLHECLQHLDPQVEIPEVTRKLAEESVIRMLEQSR